MDPPDPYARDFDPPPQPGGMPDLAEWPQRVGAALIDGLISFAVQAAVSIVSRPLAQLAGLAVFIFLQHRQGTTGRTPGKDALKIRLLREEDGQVVGFGNAVIRGLLHILDALPLGLGFLWPLWDAKKQTFADKIMKTVVVKG
ncbi:MAG TPA: RDD family protein [Mycobacteriales bacterium]|nr:RDD family protein [Mycobacteriales bacterium]